VTNVNIEPGARLQLDKRVVDEHRPGVASRGRRRRRHARGLTRYVDQGRSVSLAVADAACLILASLSISGGAVRPAPVVLAIAWVALGSAVYKSSRRLGVGLARTALDDVANTLKGVLLAVAATEVAEGRSLSPATSLLFLTLLGLSACLSHQFVLGFWERRRPDERVLMVGGAQAVHRFRRKLVLEATLRGELVGAIELVQHGEALSPDALLAATREVVDELDCDRVVVNAEDLNGDQLRAMTRVGVEAQIKMSVLPASTGAIGSRARLSHLADLPMIEFDCRRISHLQGAVKHCFDLLLSAGLLVVVSPLMVLIAIAVWIDDRGPIFFRQVRGGLAGVPFTMLKFRTMHVDAEQLLADLFDIDGLADPMYKLKQDPRITRVGSFLRRTSLDELPQLINVLRGEMSMVGPRPEEHRLVQRYDEHALAIRCGMNPGITGPMQVHGRGELTFQERLDCEREYLENYSLSRDLRILAMTGLQLFGTRLGAY
jgi:exopolysaccharide biosynthesis polyprenyl glycosylphosphotransferase